MAQPTQVYPPWLTPSLVTVTNAAGVPEATDTTVVYLPLTYYGPSIPLGSAFTFGGTTSPASAPVAPTPLPLTTTAISPLTTTATPTTSLSTSASSNTSSRSSSLTATTTPSATSTSPHLSVLTKGQLIGVIVASILGLIFFFVLALFLFLWCKGRRNRQSATLVPQEEDVDYYVLSPTDVEGYNPEDLYGGTEGHRAPGEGSPRHSGDEASTFLRRSRAGGPSSAETSAAGAATSTFMSQVPTELGVSRAIPRIPRPTTTSNSSGSQSSNSHASGFGVLIDRPNQGLGYLPSMPEDPQGTGISTADLHRQDQENDTTSPDDPDLYQDGEYTGAYAYAPDTLLAPPQFLNPDNSPLTAEFASRMSDLSEAEVLTAERHTIGSLVGTQTTPELPDLPGFSSESSPRNSGLLGAIGLGGLANLGRRSWFRNLEPHRYSPDFTVEPFTETDLETGRGLLSPDHGVDSRGRRVGLGPDGTRPTSASSARSATSGTTLYHDAQSSTHATPILPPATPILPPLPPLPSAVTPASAPTTVDLEDAPPDAEHNWRSIASAGLGDTGRQQSSTPDTPLLSPPPKAATPASASTSTLGLKMPSFPPGLDTVKPVGWSDVATEVTGSSAAASPFGGALLNNSLSSSGRVTIDLLEDAPPGAELGWRSMASAGFGDAGRRGTFGLFLDQSGFMSEQGSLYSMRSHLNPSVRSTGSAPASRKDGPSSMNSASSRPSAHSLARTGSISSDGRRRQHPNSPTLSAFGHSHMRPSPLANHNFDEPSSATIGSPPSAHVSPDKSSTIRSLSSNGSAVVTVVNDTSSGTAKESMGLVRSGSTSQMSSASFPLNSPWAAGLDNDWIPAA